MIAVAAGDDVANLFTAFGGNAARRSTVFKSFEGCLDHVVGVCGPLRLGHDVLDAHGFKNGTHRTACDDTGTGGSRPEHHFASAEVAFDIVVQGPAFPKGNADHLTLGGFRRLTDGFRNLASLTVTEADLAFAVADNDESGKGEPTATLDDLGDAVDTDELVDQFDFIARLFITVVAAFTAISALGRSCLFSAALAISQSPRTKVRLRGRHRPTL